MNGFGIRGQQLLSAGKRFDAAPGVMSKLFARLFLPGFGAIINQIDAGMEKGSLLAHLPDGTHRVLGGRGAGFEAELYLYDWRALLRLAGNGVIGWYQAYEAGEWESADLASLFALMSANARTLGNAARSSGPLKWAAKLAHWMNRNSKAGSRRNISAHYDLGNDFYAPWLGETMSYSSGVFAPHCKPSSQAQFMDELRLAQMKKMTNIANRASPPPGGKVLEIGCGWGSQALIMAGAQDVSVDAISLSQEQLAWCRAARDGASSQDFAKVDFRHQDYRDVHGQYDAIVSVEMVEALGRKNWPRFMACLARNLKPGGRAAIQYISMADDLFETYASTVDFIQAYIFPGGMLIKTSEFKTLAHEAGLSWQNQVDFGLDYAETLAIWQERFDQVVAENKLPEGFDARFTRLWKFYLSYCEGGFRAGNINVHQVTLIKEQY